MPYRGHTRQGSSRSVTSSHEKETPMRKFIYTILILALAGLLLLVAWLYYRKDMK